MVVKTANEIWRDFETDGVPASGAHKPVKSDIRAWGTQFELLGGFNAPGVDTNAALFSAGTGVPPIWRKIVGFDLPNPSNATPGAVFALPGVANQVLAGLGGDGEFDLAPVTGTGSVVLQNNPNITGTMFLNGQPMLFTIAGYSVLQAPDGRWAWAAGGTSDPANYHKAVDHYFFNFDGTHLFGRFFANGLMLGTSGDRIPLTGAQVTAALQVFAGWNTTGAAAAVDISIADTASNINSKIIQGRTGASGATVVWSVDKNGNIVGNNQRVNGALTFGDSRVLSYRYQLFNVNANAVGDTPITINIPGATKFRISGITATNVGTTASLNVAAAAVYTAAGGGGTAIVAINALAALTTNALNTQGNLVAFPSGNFATTFWANNTQFFFRITTAQGAAAAVDVAFNVEAYG